MQSTLTRSRPAASKAPQFLKASTAPALTLPASELRGIHLVVAETSAVRGQVEAGDLLSIDFDEREFRSDGLYVVGLPRGACVRRIDRSLRGPVIDDCGTPCPLPADVQILGRVLQVYAPRRVSTGLH